MRYSILVSFRNADIVDIVTSGQNYALFPVFILGYTNHLLAAASILKIEVSIFSTNL